MESIVKSKSVAHGVVRLVLEDADLEVPKEKLMQGSDYIKDLFEHGLEDNVIVLKGVGCQITKHCIEKLLQFAELSERFQIKIKKPILCKETIFSVVPPAFAEFALSF